MLRLRSALESWALAEHGPRGGSGHGSEQAPRLAAFVRHMLIRQQLIPIMRFDGYYVVTDLTGVQDILSRIKAIFRARSCRAASTSPRSRSSGRGCKLLATRQVPAHAITALSASGRNYLVVGAGFPRWSRPLTLACDGTAGRARLRRMPSARVGQVSPRRAL